MTWPDYQSWDTPALENYIRCAEHELDERQRKLTLVRAILAARTPPPFPGAVWIVGPGWVNPDVYDAACEAEARKAT